MKKKIIIISLAVVLILTSLVIAQPTEEPQFQSKGGKSLSDFLYEFNQLEDQVQMQYAVVLYFMSVSGKI
jgi:hypothetical protein